MVQISGKMLIARRRIIVGAMNSQAMARSERPRTRRASRAGVAAALRVMIDGVDTVSFMAQVWPQDFAARPSHAAGTGGGSGDERVQSHLILPSSLNTFCQSLISASSASFAVPLSATT